MGNSDDMQPSKSVDDLTNARFTNAIVLGDAANSVPMLTKSANLDDLLHSQSRSPIELPSHFTRIKSTLENRIAYVIGIRSQKQVRRSEAGAIITLMADEKAVRNGAKCQLISQAMSWVGFVGNPQCSISTTFGAWPFQAGVIFWHRLRQQVFQKFKAGNLILHRWSLQSTGCMAPRAFTRFGAFCILPQEGL